MQTIELDAPPWLARPNDLIWLVVRDTVLEEIISGWEPKDFPTPFFGHATFSFDIPRDIWMKEIQPVIKPRIENLYRIGMIRYGSW